MCVQLYSGTAVQLYSDLASGQHTLHSADVWTLGSFLSVVPRLSCSRLRTEESCRWPSAGPIRLPRHQTRAAQEAAVLVLTAGKQESEDQQQSSRRAVSEYSSASEQQGAGQQISR